MPKTLRPFLAGALALASLASPARADESNFRPYLVGARAAGMGGAFTALADDGAGPWYNPGGLAFVQRSQLSVAGSVYGLVTGSFQNALGDGHDFNYSTLNTFPTATAAVWRYGDPGSQDADVLSLGVFLPDAMNIDDRAGFSSGEGNFFLSDQFQTVWGGLTYAHRMGRLGVGATGFVIFGSRVSQFDITRIAGSNPGPDFGTISGRTDETVLGFAGALGLRWDVSDEFKVGLSVYSPAFGGGRRRFFGRLTWGVSGGPIATVVNDDHLHASLSDPLRVQGGVAWTEGALTLAADVQYLGARQTWDDKGRAAEGLDKRVKRNGVVNGSVGLEYLVSGHYPVRAGFFTDFAASPTPVTYSIGSDPNSYNTSHVDRFGGTFSVGIRSEHTATDVGVNLSAGTGKDLVPDNLNFNLPFKPATSTQFLVYFFLGTSYEF